MVNKINYTGTSIILNMICNAINGLIDGGGGGSISADNVMYNNSITGLLNANNVQDAIDEISQDFRVGCDLLVSAVTAQGQTPASNSPADIANAIYNISGGSDITINDKLINQFNAPVIIEDGTRLCYQMFQNFIGFNQVVNIPDSVFNCVQMFINCNNYNCPVVFSEGVTDCTSALQNCFNFNQSVYIGNNVTKCTSLLSNCRNFNNVVYLGNKVSQTQSMFNFCLNYNQPLTIPNTVTNSMAMFANCMWLDSPITIDSDLITDMSQMFKGCVNYNKPVHISTSAYNFYMMFDSCPIRFNQPIDITINYTSTTVNMTQMFANCASLNSPVNFNFDANFIVLNSAFVNCIRFNQPITFPNNARYMQMTFASCSDLNSPIVLGNNVVMMQNTFFNCYNYNQRMVIPSRVENLYGCFNNCSNLASPVYINAYSIRGAGTQYMFFNCTNLSDVYISSIRNSTQFSRSFRNNTTAVRCNIHTDETGKNYLRTTSLLSNYATPTWTDDPDNNCIYNTTVNIYIYNNWDGVIT